MSCSYSSFFRDKYLHDYLSLSALLYTDIQYKVMLGIREEKNPNVQDLDLFNHRRRIVAGRKQISVNLDAIIKNVCFT